MTTMGLYTESNYYSHFTPIFVGVFHVAHFYSHWILSYPYFIGVMVPPEKIIQSAIDENVDIIESFKAKLEQHSSYITFVFSIVSIHYLLFITLNILFSLYSVTLLEAHFNTALRIKG